MGGLLTLAQHDSHPVAPPSGSEHLYFYSDGLLYRMSGDGIATAVDTTGGGGGTTHAMVRKTADESVTSSTTLQDDNELLFAIGASEVWQFEFVLFYTAPYSVDLKVTLTAPAGVSFLRWGAVAGDPTDDITITLATINPVTVSGTAAIMGAFGTDKMGFIKGVVVNGATAGNILLRWAQNASNATAATIRAGSYLIAHKIA